jgi:DNA-binding transcriptional LysR family regulator
MAWFRIVRHACRTVGVDPRVALSSDAYRAVQAFVAAGLGVAVIPGLAVARAAPGVETRRLRVGAPARRICAVHPDGSLPAARRTPRDHHPGDHDPAAQDTSGMTCPAISSIWRRSSPTGQKCTRWQPAPA